MPRKAALLALATTALLAVLTAIVLRQPPAGPTAPDHADPQRLGATITPAVIVPLPPSALLAAEWTFTDTAAPDQPFRIVPDPDLSLWRLEHRDLGIWSVDPARLRAAARLLAETPTLGPAPEFPHSATVSIDPGPRSGGRWTLTLGPPGLAGRTPAMIQGPADAAPRRVYIPTDAANAFRPGGLRSWRDPALFLPSPAPWSRVEIASPDARLVLARVGPTWSVIEPFPARADPAAVNALLARLAALRPDAFADPDLGTTADDPAARIVLAADLPGAPRRTAVQSLTLDRADPPARGLIATAIHPLDGSPPSAFRGTAHVALPPDALASLLTTDPYALASKTASPRVPADVSILRLAAPGRDPIEFTRLGDRWSRDGRPADADDLALIPALIEWLTQTPASRVAADPQRPARGLVALARVQATDHAAPDDAWYTLFTPGPASDASSAAIADGRLLRLYDTPPRAAIARLRALLGDPPAR
ncbi:MAG: hypothetical protein HRU70_02525 [Phycisphaeraceae bacterium]|nr:MAG: hypothetical protein HRU70_02525 [Phycisphaeraceae bacterium]